MQDAIDHAQQAMEQKNWSEAIKRWQKILMTYKDQAPAEAYILLSMAHRYQGTPDVAEKIVKIVLDKFPLNLSALCEFVETARARKDWPAVAERLQKLKGSTLDMKNLAISDQGPSNSFEYQRSMVACTARLCRNKDGAKYEDEKINELFSQMKELKVFPDIDKNEPLRTEGAWIWQLDEFNNGVAFIGRVSKDVDRVALLFNERVLGSANVNNGIFGFRINDSKNALAESSRFSIISNKGLVLHAGANDFWVTEPPFVSEGKPVIDIDNALNEGCRLTKKGSIIPKYPEMKEKTNYLKTYCCLCSFFQKYYSYPVLVSHGTLLGLYRDGEIIPYDDDFDCFYLSSKNNVKDIVQERLDILSNLYKEGIFFHLSHTGHIKIDILGVVIDLMPSWIEGNTLNIAGYTSMKYTQDFIEPYSKLPFADGYLWTFSNPKVFLEDQYGNSWRTPDPSYRYNLSLKALENQQKLWPAKAELLLCLKSAKAKLGVRS